MITSNKGTGKAFGSASAKKRLGQRRQKRPNADQEDNGKLLYAFMISLFLLQASITYITAEYISTTRNNQETTNEPQ